MITRVELNAALIRSATQFAGPDSEVVAWVRQQIEAGRNPREIAMQLKGALRKEATP